MPVASGDGVLRCAQDDRFEGRGPKKTSPRLTLAPPSTGKVTPVMKLASSDARNSAALATSQPVPILRLSGTFESRSASTWVRGLLNSRARVSTAIGVFIRPGRITLARMPYWGVWEVGCVGEAHTTA